MPFEVPDGWCWTTIEDLLINRDSERIPLSLAVRNKQHKKEYNYYGAAGVIDKVEGYLFSERLLLIGEDGANLLSRAKDNAFFADGKYWVNNHAHVLDCSEKEVLTYVALVINSIALDPYVTGSAQPKLSQDNLNKILIPLPPLAEQRRIIYAINNYSGYLSNIENDKESIEHIIDLLKQLILNLAITGKLVSQELNDEPAIELLKRINPNYKPCDNRHYENLQSGWQEVAFDHIFKSIPTKRFQVQQKEIQPKGTVPVISQSANYIEGYTDDIDKIFTATPVIIFGDHTRVVKFVDFPFVVGADGVKIYSTKIFPPYGYYLIEYAAHNIENKGYGRHSQYIAKQRYPLPPYDEQKRIVESIRKMFMTIDSIVADL